MHSVATSLAALWGDELWHEVKKDTGPKNLSTYFDMADHTSAEQKLAVLSAVSDRLEHDFGTWRMPWGEINRYQRLTGDIVQTFTDAGPSIPIEFSSSRWGSLASYGAHGYEGTKGKSISIRRNSWITPSANTIRIEADCPVMEARKRFS